MFSFFRKNQDGALKPDSRPSSAARAGQPAPVSRTVSSAAPPLTRADLLTIGEVSAGALASAEMGSVVEEAAVLYASDRSDQAAALLQDYVRSYPERPDAQPWLMLFEIYQIQGKKPQFDELALEFVVKFERTAPIWSDAKVLGAKTEKAQAGPAAEGYVSLAGFLKGDKDSLFQSMMQTAQKGAGLRIDFSRLEGVDATGSRRLVETLQELKKSGKKITPLNVPHLADLLKTLIGQGGEDEPAHWLLLLSLYQCQGMQTEFEDLAVEYAITFEVSPPSWESVPQCKQVAAGAAAPPVAAAPHDNDAFYLSGVISAASESQLQEMANFAAARSEVFIDMTDVYRVDFVSVGGFVAALAGLSRSGKKVMIRNANEMIRALFGIMGADQFATVMRRKIG